MIHILIHTTLTTRILWKATIKKFIGWQTNAEKENIIENIIIYKYKESVKVYETEGGSIVLSVTHTNPEKASKYANSFMEEVRILVDYESKTAQDQKIAYLSETLADAVQEMETAQKNLKDYTLKNSVMAQENFISGSLKWTISVWKDAKFLILPNYFLS